jgi:hypothetical protein
MSLSARPTSTAYHGGARLSSDHVASYKELAPAGTEMQKRLAGSTSWKKDSHEKLLFRFSMCVP